MAWTEKMVEDLKIMWKQGLTTGEIGKRLGVSKNSIVGKVHRLQLDARPSPIKKKDEKTISDVSKNTSARPSEEKAPAEKSAPAAKPAEAPEKPADSEPAAKEASVAEEPVEIDENFGMPEGGFRQFDEAAPAENPEETAAPAEAVPAEGTPAA